MIIWLGLNRLSLWLKVFVLASFYGCASYTQETREIRSFYKSGNIDQALEKLESSSLSRSKTNRLLYLLEKSSLKLEQNKQREAQSLLISADRIVDELKTVSASKTAASFVVNDAVQDYSGEDYEIVTIHTMLALSFLRQGKLKEARIEAKKINSRLHEINQQYDAKSKNKYQQDAFALFLAGLVWEAKGEWDDAIIDYRKALKLYEGPFQKFYSGQVPKSLVASLKALLAKRGRRSLLKQLDKKYPQTKAINLSHGSLVVIHPVGHIAVKSAKEFVVPIGKQIIRFSFPIIEPKRSRYIGKTGVDLNGRYYRAENVQDMNAIAYYTLEDRRLRLVLKQGARLLAKGQAVELAYERGGPIAGIAANIFSAVTETADTRSWTLLPEAFYISRVNVKPSTKRIKVYSNSKLGYVAQLPIKKNEMKFLIVGD